MRKALRNAAHDAGVCLAIGAVVALAAVVILTVIGALAGGFQLRPGLVAARGGLLVIGSLHLFVCAGMLIRPKTGEKLVGSPAWRKRFRCFGLTSVTGLLGVELILVASVLDYLLYFK